MLESCARLRIGRTGSYRFWGLVGFAAGVLLATAVALARGLGVTLPLLVAATCVVAFAVTVKLSVIVFAHERIVFYEHVVASLALNAGILTLTGRPVLAGLDLAIIGIGCFLVFGRVGCLAVGCCHGRPARRGIRYPPGHAAAGFAAHLVGVPLFPIQLVEALLSAALVTASVVVVLGRAAPGAAVVLYLTGYGVARFGLELMRGDDARPVWLGLSQAQWTALLVAALLAWRAGGLLWWIAAGLLAAAGALAVAVRTARWTRWWLGAPARARQLGEALAGLCASVALATAETRFGLLLSSSLNPDGSRHFALSRRDRPLTTSAAAAVADQLAVLLGAPPARPTPGRTPGLFHLDLAAPAARAA